MSTPADDLKTILEDKGVATFKKDMFVAKEPADPHDVITLYDTGGFPPNPKHPKGQPTVMVRVRNTGYKDGYAKAREVKDALLGLPKQDINSTTYVGVWMEGDIGFVRYDDSDRAIFTMNFRVSREPPASGNRKEV